MGASSNILSEPFAPNQDMTIFQRLVAGLYYYFTDHMYDEALVSVLTALLKSKNSHQSDH